MTAGHRTADILKQLRSHMRSLKHFSSRLSAYIIPSSDAHGSEYLAERDERRAYVSGFTGSAGTAVVTDSMALLWTDARYHVQAGNQLDEQHWMLMKEGLPGVLGMGQWLATNLESGNVVGVDPRLVSGQLWNKLSDELGQSGVELSAVSTNLVDLVVRQLNQSPSTDDPPSSVFHHPLRFSGVSIADKLASVRADMRSVRCSLLVLAALDEVAYILNLRGSDIAFNPVFFAYCAVEMDALHVFIEPDKVSDSVRAKVCEEAGSSVHFHDYNAICDFCLDKYKKLAEDKVWLCPLASRALHAMFPKHTLHVDRTPVCKMKAIKNTCEIEGMYSAHRRDAAALCSYLCWLEEQVTSGKSVTELSGAKRLQQFRSEQEHYKGLSFETISAVGSNAAIIHYAPSADTDSDITDRAMYLVDSGGQYSDGTTDVTRTVHFGSATDHQKECFTRVLKGHIALASSVFPENTRGTLLDPLARQALWRVGLDYGHGTGHGVGSFLNVHEGPMTIHSRPQPVTEPGLKPNMFVSNEPGYYETGEFGIRLENIVQVVETETPHKFGGRQFLTFKNVTMVPIQTSVLVTALLTSEEITWLNEYHAECYRQVSPLLLSQGRTEVLTWLQKQTQPI